MSRGGSRFGAGRKCRNVKAELTLALDIRVLKREGYLTRRYPFVWTWITNHGEKVASATILIQDKSVSVGYIWYGHDTVSALQLESTPCNFGGSRLWFKCPHCEGRCARVFFNRRDGYYACRMCVGVAYYSQSEDQIDRVGRRQSKLESRLYENWMRPKGMHHSTHKRMLNRIQEYEELRESLLFSQGGKCYCL